MSERRRGLGRGLGALIPSHPAFPAVPAPSPVDVLIPERNEARVQTWPADGWGADARDSEPGPGNAVGAADASDPGEHEEPRQVAAASFAEISAESIVPNPRQPRQVFDEDELAELVDSIRQVGLLQPVVVRPAGERYELVMGERRWRAAQAAGLSAIPAIVRETDDTVMLRDALLENLHRSQLNPLEEAAAYDQLLQDFGCTHEELGARIGRSRPQISNTLRLLRLPPLVQRRVAAGVLTAGHARALLAFGDAGAQERIAQRIVAEGLSVRAVEELAAVGGDEPEPRVRRRTATPVAPGLTDLAARLSDRFETRVKVDLGRSKGRITIEFASVEDLERIVAAMGAGAEPATDSSG